MGKGHPRAVEKGVATTITTATATTTAVVAAPVFHPNDAEFADPLAYIAKIRPLAEPFGICRIVPPKSWSPPFALDRRNFSFPTKSQSIHRLQARAPSLDPRTFLLQYDRFRELVLGRKRSSRGRVVFEGEELDLCCFFNGVKRYGGYRAVGKGKLWGEVARFVRPGVKVSDCGKHVLSQLYLEHLLDFEEYCRDGIGGEGIEGNLGSRKVGIEGDMGSERLGIGGKGIEGDLGSEKVRTRAKGGSGKQVLGRKRRKRNGSSREEKEEDGINGKGVEVGVGSGKVGIETNMGSEIVGIRENGVEVNMGGSEKRVLGKKMRKRNGGFRKDGVVEAGEEEEKGLDRACEENSRDGIMGKAIEVDMGSGKCKERVLGRKGRKRRKDTEVEVGEENQEKVLDQICEQCKSGLHGEVMLLCDRCDKGWHLHCLSPPLKEVPAGSWYCLECVNSDKDCFGFVPGKLCTVDEFRRIDDRMRRKWFGQLSVSRVQVEKLFWEIVEGKAGEVDVMYGNDLDTSLYGSGFPRVNDAVPSSMDPNVWGHYASSPWNLNNLPKLQGSMLRAVHDNIAGVMVPWLYIGMLFSAFCWHVEDHCFYSINYLHWGEPKCWYGVPGAEANAFEQVMRKALPDLFEAQPDLLFQLVTMLNPSILQQNGVPVYGVLQEPGNFVITFPRSYHGGFNLGLNCAEAVNFAPADWLPHGGVGAELYRVYHKAAVLSHEELLCVATKNGCDPHALSYMKQELARIFTREKKCREELWVNGIVRSSQMVPKKQPNFVGTEEDPICIICQQYLYLSSVTCSCRPSSYVCLEHWKHLCECNPDKHHFLYRHTLAELGDLAHMSLSAYGKATGVEALVGREARQLDIPNRSSIISRKVKGGNISFTQVAEDWLSNARQIFGNPFSIPACTNALKEAEQFLWADHDMDSVRDMATKLNGAQCWVLNVNSCLRKIDSYLNSQKNEKVSLIELEQLLDCHSVPCLEPGLPKLKRYAEDAQCLYTEIESALLSHSCKIADLELLYSRASKLPVSLPNTQRLSDEISSSKVWLDRITLCLRESKPGSVDIIYLKNLKSKMLELHLNLPEKELFMTFCKEADVWQMRSEEMLQSSFTLKELEVFLLSADNLTVSIPEINLLRKYNQDARSWILESQNVLGSIIWRNDYGNIVKDLSEVLEAGKLLRVQVDELPLVETELRRSSCREKASQVLHAVVPMQFIQQVLQEASQLGIETEKLFVDISGILIKAVSLEDRAKSVLEHGAPIALFEDILRDSRDILVSLPSVPCVEDALSHAQSWLVRSQPYLYQSTDDRRSGLLLKIDELKELVFQSKSLKVTLDAPKTIESTLRKIEGWEDEACLWLKRAKMLLNEQDVNCLVNNHYLATLDEVLGKIDSAIEAAQIMNFEFKELNELTSVSCLLKWCSTVLSFCHRIPSIKEVDSTLEDADRVADIFSGCLMVEELLKGTKWLRKALLVLVKTQEPQSSLKDVEKILEETHIIVLPYPEMVAELQRAIKKHDSWLHQFRAIFAMTGEQYWPSLMKLKELGEIDALRCSELDLVDFEVRKIEGWRLQCHAILEPLIGNLGSLSEGLEKIKYSLEKALTICNGSNGHRKIMLCVCSSNDPENKEVYTCLTCQDRFHFSCMNPPLSGAGTADGCSCPFCLCIENGVSSRSEGLSLICRGNRPQMKSFSDLLTSAGSLFKGLPEVNTMEEIIQQALQCSSCLTDIIKNALSHSEEDLSSVSESLLTAIKAVSVAEIEDHQVSCTLKSAVSRNSWKLRVKRLMKGSKKPVIQQIQRLMKEGLAFSIPPEDYFMKEIVKAQEISLHWVEIAKKVASDGGELPLREVYKLIKDGENLPIHFDKELKLLRARSMLYCICRKPYDQRAMIACDQCDEWYHFDCINLSNPPKTFFCPACQPACGEIISLSRPIYSEERSNNECEPHTPPAFDKESKWRNMRKIKSCSEQKVQNRVDLIDILRSSSDLEQLWREKKRPLQRKAKRSIKLEGPSC